MPDINHFYQLVIQACNDPNIGYSQSKRRTISLGVSYQTFCDCSSLPSWALTLSGFFSNNPWFTTANEISQIQRAGFVQVPINDEWKAGDILWKNGHTEIVYSGRITMGAHTDGVAFPQQVSINNKATSPSYYTSCWRYGNGADPGEPVKSIKLSVVSAISGNFWRESHVNPAMWEGLVIGGPGFGLGQWTGDRRTNLFNWMDSHGYSRDNGDGQIEFLIAEGDWIDTPSSPLHYDSLMDFLTTTETDIPKLTETYMRCWERPGVPALEERVAFAEKAYTWLNSHGGDKVDWIAGNRYLSEEEALNNTIRVYQKLGLLIGGGEGGQGWSNLLKYGCYRELYRRSYIWR